MTVKRPGLLFKAKTFEWMLVRTGRLIGPGLFFKKKSQASGQPNFSRKITKFLTKLIAKTFFPPFSLN